MHKTLRQKLRDLLADMRQRRQEWIGRAVALFYGLVLAERAYAGILSAKMCVVYNAIFDNAFVGAAAMFAFTLMFLKWKFSEKGSEAIGTGFKIGTAVTFLLSLGTLLGWLGATPC